MQEYRYYYKHEAEQYSFIRIPKMLMTGALFAPLSIQAKILYGLLLDRVGEARKNQWVDDENKVYVIYPINEIMEDMGSSKAKAVKSLAELTDVGLVEKKQRGLGLPSLLYVKNFVVDQEGQRVPEV